MQHDGEIRWDGGRINASDGNEHGNEEYGWEA